METMKYLMMKIGRQCDMCLNSSNSLMALDLCLQFDVQMTAHRDKF